MYGTADKLIHFQIFQFLDRNAIEKAIEGSNTVIETVGCVSEGTRIILQTMKKYDVKRLIVVFTTNAKDDNDLPDKKFSVFIGFSTSRADMANFLLSQVTDTTYIRQAPAISS